MRICPKCDKQYSDDVAVCPDDGTALLDAAELLPTLDAEVEPDGDAEDQAEEPALATGTTVGAYSIVKLLGEGGMGQVYLAEHTKLQRRVALKILRAAYTQNRTVLRRFFHEARAVNMINHEHIVEITDFIEDEESRAYYIMEYLRGQNLGECLMDEGALPVHRVLGIAIQVCEALAAVHGQGFIHRDLKPDNVFLTEKWGQRDFVKLLDFGVVKLKEPFGERELQASSPSQTGAIVGTPAYMSPEQVAGKPVAASSDLYSMGVILYEMTTGRRPFVAHSFGEYVLKHMTEPPVKPSKLENLPFKVSSRLEALTLRCLEKKPDRRPANATEIIAELMEIGEREQCNLNQFIPTAYVSVPTPTRRRSTVLWIAAAAAVLVISAGAGVLALRGTGGSDTAEPPAMTAAPDGSRPASTKVQVAFDSVPRGAEVFAPGSDQPLGMTPVTLSFDRSGEPRSFELRLAGHKLARKQIAMSEDTKVVVTLARIADQPRKKKPKHRRPRRRSGPKKKPKAITDPTGTMNPFD
jgi:serine/threonine protein kinase